MERMTSTPLPSFYLPHLLVLVILAHLICQVAPRVADCSCDCILLATWQRTMQRRCNFYWASRALKDSKRVKLRGGRLWQVSTASWSAPPRWSLLLVALVFSWACGHCGRNIFLPVLYFSIKDIHSCSIFIVLYYVRLYYNILIIQCKYISINFIHFHTLSYHIHLKTQ